MPTVRDLGKATRLQRMMVSSLSLSRKRGFDCDDYMDGWMCLSWGKLLHDWYTLRQRQMPSFASVRGFVAFVQLGWIRSDARIGAGGRRRRCPRADRRLYLECLNDTLKLMTWLAGNLLLLLAFAFLVSLCERSGCRAAYSNWNEISHDDDRYSPCHLLLLVRYRPPLIPYMYQWPNERL
jgi:hypothetical protein